jgi:ATP-binding cassette, subfamily B, bacterial PglK
VTTMRALATTWRALTPAQRRHFGVLQLVSVLMALSTVVGLAAVMSFLAVLADPTLIEVHGILNSLRRILGFSTQQGFLLALGGVFIVLLMLSAILNLAGSRAMGRFAFAVGDRIRETVFAEHLRRDYLFHSRVGAGRLMDDVLYQADRVAITLFHGLLLSTNAMLTLLIVASIALVNPAVAFGGALIFTGSYLLLYRIMRARVAHNGKLQTDLGGERLAVVEQAFHGIKYLLVAGAQPAFSRRFAAVTRTLSQTFADTLFIAQFPRYILECVAGVALIAGAVLISGASGGPWLAKLSFIGFAGIRLLPAFQQMYNALVVVRANRPAIELLASHLGDGVPVSRVPQSHLRSTRLELLREIEMIGVSFQYSPESQPVLNDATIRIPVGHAIAIIGASGCGKTTLIDLIIGLLLPTGGRIEVDGEALDLQRIAAWQQSIGYVPQDVMILDATVRENIAFGVASTEIDDARVFEAARLAGANEFIEAIPDGYRAKLLRVGGGLSGGQRQRLGIARALYHRPSLLVLDEATNSLDASTERAIIDGVIRNRGGRTVLIAAHASAVIEACDRIYELRDGKLHDRGTPQAARRPSDHVRLPEHLHA